MKVGELLDMLGALHASCEEVDPPLSDEQWRDLDIVIRGNDVDDNDFCGGVTDVAIEETCDGESCVLVIDASNEPGTK